MWNTATIAGERSLGILRTIVLARLLVPEDFGLLGLSITVAGAFEAFTTTGIQAALIQRPHVDSRILNAAWTLGLARGLGLGLVIVLVSSPAAWYFAEPRLEGIFRVLAINQVLNGLANVGLVHFVRDLNFRARASYELRSGALGTTVAVLFALWMGNVWALVLAEVAGAAIRTGLSYLAHPFRPRLAWDGEALRSLFAFGRHVAVFRMVDYLLISGDDLLAGKLLGPGPLGLYGMAYQVANVPATGVAGAVAGVAFPALARVQADTDAVIRGYARILRLVAFASLPLGAGLVVLSPELVGLVYGSEWLPMVPALSLLAVYGSLRALGYTVGPLLQSIGSPDALRNLGAIQLVVFLGTAVPMTRAFGLPGLAGAVSLGVLVFDVLAFRTICRKLHAGWRVLLWPSATPALCAIGMGVLLHAGRPILPLDGWLGVGAVVAAAAAFYLGAVRLLDPAGAAELASLLRGTGPQDEARP